MKIAFLSFYNGRVDRGVEVATRVLAKGLSPLFDVTLFQAGINQMYDVKTVVLNSQKNWPEDSSNSFLRIIYLDYYSIKILWFTLLFLPYFIKERYDVVVPTNGGWQSVILRLVTWLYHKKLLVQGNAGIGRDDWWQLAWKPDEFIAISPQGYKWAKKVSASTKIRYIPFGVSVGQILTAKPAHVALNKPIVLCVSALLPYKRIDLLIRAVSLLPDVSLLIIGFGPDEKRIRDLGEKMLGKRINLLTEVKHNQLFSFYKSADVFSLPSASTEALGIVYLEAMAAGLPIVAPDDYHRRSLLKDIGIYVDPTDAPEYARGIKKALEVSDKNRIIEFAKQFDWDKIIQTYAEVISSM